MKWWRAMKRWGAQPGSGLAALIVVGALGMTGGIIYGQAPISKINPFQVTAGGVNKAEIDEDGNAQFDGVVTAGSANTVLTNADGTLRLDALEAVPDIQVDLETDVTGVLPDANVADDLTIDGGTVNNAVIGAVTPAAATFSTTTVSAATPFILLTETDAATNNKNWAMSAGAEQLGIGAFADNLLSVQYWVLVDRTDAAVDRVQLQTGGTTRVDINGATTTVSSLVATTADIQAGTVADAALSSNVAHLNVAETIASNWVNTANPWADNEVAANLTISGGTVNNTVIGGSTPAAATFTDLTASGTVNLAGATVSNGGAVTTVDINGGTIDGATIGGSSAGAGTFTTLAAGGATFSAEVPATLYSETDAATDNKLWTWGASSEQFLGSALNSGLTGEFWIIVDRTAGVIDRIQFQTGGTTRLDVNAGVVTATSLAVGVGSQTISSGAITGATNSSLAVTGEGSVGDDLVSVTGTYASSGAILILRNANPSPAANPIVIKHQAAPTGGQFHNGKTGGDITLDSARETAMFTSLGGNWLELGLLLPFGLRRLRRDGWRRRN